MLDKHVYKKVSKKVAGSSPVPITNFKINSMSKERKAIIDANMSYTGKQEIVKVVGVYSNGETALIAYPNGYTEHMMISALTFVN